MKIKFLSYNIRSSTDMDEAKHTDELQKWKYRKEALAKVIKKQSSDVLGVQEDSLEQVEFLKEKFGKKYFVLEHPGLVKEKSHELNTIFVKKKFQVKDSGYFWISETPGKKSKLKNSIAYRHANYAKIMINKKEYLIINAHFDHNWQDEDFKKKEAETFVKIVKEKFGEEIKNAVILGDFNFRTDSHKAHIELSKHLVDVSKVKEVREPTISHWFWHDVYSQIDYFWVSEDLKEKIIDFKIIKDTYKRKDGRRMCPSDHYTIKLVLSS